jgi:hypothetical protein
VIRCVFFEEEAKFANINLMSFELQHFNEVGVCTNDNTKHILIAELNTINSIVLANFAVRTRTFEGQ